MTDRSKLLAEASSASERLMDFITDNPDWQMPEPKAVISLETAAAFAMVYAKERAGAEAAAMRERAAKLCDERGAEEQKGFGLTRAAQNYFRARDAIRTLPATGEE